MHKAEYAIFKKGNSCFSYILVLAQFPLRGPMHNNNRGSIIKRTLKIKYYCTACKILSVNTVPVISKHSKDPETKCSIRNYCTLADRAKVSRHQHWWRGFLALSESNDRFDFLWKSFLYCTWHWTLAGVFSSLMVLTMAFLVRSQILAVWQR